MLDRRDLDQVQRGWGDEGPPPDAGAPADAGAGRRACQLLQGIAGDLSGNGITFPTFIDATVKVRSALSDADIDAAASPRS